MKYVNHLLGVFIFLISFHIFPLAFAQADEVGNGEGVLIRDNEIILIDPFIKKKDYSDIGDRLLLSSELKSYLGHARNLAEVYGVTSSTFWNEKVFGEKVEYRYTEELPCDDKFDLVKGTQGTPMLVGCTIDEKTWLKESLFTKLNLRQQTIVIIHERLHAFTFRPHYELCQFTATLDQMLALENEQIKGNLRKLTGPEWEAVSRFQEAGKIVGFKGYDEPFLNLPWTRAMGKAMAKAKQIILPFGGGVTFAEEGKEINPQISPQAFVGIGVIIPHYNSTVSEGAEILQSKVYGTSIGKRTKVHFSHLQGVTVGEESLIEKSFLESRWIKMTIEDHVVLSNATLVNSNAEVNIQKGVQLKNMNIVADGVSRTPFPGIQRYKEPKLIFAENRSIDLENKETPVTLWIDGHHTVSTKEEVLVLTQKAYEKRHEDMLYDDSVRDRDHFIYLSAFSDPGSRLTIGGAQENKEGEGKEYSPRFNAVLVPARQGIQGGGFILDVGRDGKVGGTLLSLNTVLKADYNTWLASYFKTGVTFLRSHPQIKPKDSLVKVLPFDVLDVELPMPIWKQKFSEGRCRLILGPEVHGALGVATTSPQHLEELQKTTVGHLKKSSENGYGRLETGANVLLLIGKKEAQEEERWQMGGEWHWIEENGSDIYHRDGNRWRLFLATPYFGEKKNQQLIFSLSGLDQTLDTHLATDIGPEADDPHQRVIIRFPRTSLDLDETAYELNYECKF